MMSSRKTKVVRLNKEEQCCNACESAPHEVGHAFISSGLIHKYA